MFRNQSLTPWRTRHDGVSITAGGPGRPGGGHRARGGRPRPGRGAVALHRRAGGGGRRGGAAMTDWTIEELAGAIRQGKISPVEAAEACLARVQRLDGRLRAFITPDPEGALRAAKELEAEATGGRWRGPLHGVPLAFKDLCHLRGLPTSCGTDRKSTRLNSSHVSISYAVFCLKIKLIYHSLAPLVL